MKQSIYLHQEIVNTLRCFGELSEVINKILEEAANGEFDVMFKPACPSRIGAGRYDIDITEPNYLELLNAYSPFSSKISLRRLIYWFVENEIYEELGWEATNNYVNRKRQLFDKKVQTALNELDRSLQYAPTTAKVEVMNICNKIRDLQEYLKNGN